MIRALPHCTLAIVVALFCLVVRVDAQELSLRRTADQAYTLQLDSDQLVRFQLPLIAGAAPQVAVTEAGEGWQRMELSWDLARSVAQAEVSVELDLLFGPDFHWMPHLAPAEGFVMGQHVFRSPALIAVEDSTVVAMVPDLALVGQVPETPWFMDLDAPRQKAWLGWTETDIPEHVGFRKRPGMTVPAGRRTMAFFVTAYRDTAQPVNPWRRVATLLWDRYGRPLYRQGEPSRVPMDVYVRHTYQWAFDRWADSVWQEFDWDGRRVGAPQFIVNISQSPNYPGPWFQREFLSIWNQAWFSSLRSASGLARWARRRDNPDWQRKADLTKALALAAPMKDGIFPAVIRTDNELVEVDGKQVQRPQPWSKAYWTNSNRCPRNVGITPDWYHLLDASWTCLLMLRWHEELAQDEELIRYCRTYADKLLTLQDEAGYFPGWLHPETLEPAEIMSQTPETALSVTFLLKLSELTDQLPYRQAALRAVDCLLQEVVPQGRWEDYETYWSCCRFGREDHVGRKYERNNMYKQNSLSMFWTAEALLAAYRVTGQQKYLQWGLRTLDELSMCQQVWQPPFIYVPALGGFGVMNFDGEWNDSRQCLFAELFMDYYQETGDARLFERGVAALRSSFIMMYCPENPRQKVQWEKAHPYFGPADYGFTMENYGHGGRTSPEGGGIGVFTIYDWGNGAASEARNRIYDHYGDVYVDQQRGLAFGIDAVAVKRTADTLVLENQDQQPRQVKIRYSSGATRHIQLQDQVALPGPPDKKSGS